MCCFFFVSLFRPSPSRQFGQVQATLRNFLGGFPSGVAEGSGVAKFACIVGFCTWILAGAATICHLVGSFGSG